MQIIIDIDEDYFKIINKNGASNYTEEVIKNGTILPKEYGRLIDADAIIAEATKKMKYPSNHKYMECVIAHMNLAPTIIAGSNCTTLGKELTEEYEDEQITESEEEAWEM